MDNPGGLPPWRDTFKEDENDGEDWKINAKKAMAKDLYNQWGEVFSLLRAMFEIIKTSDEEPISAEMMEDQKEMYLSDAYMVATKIQGAEAGDSYVIRMQNAAIIRQLASGIQSMTYGFFMEDPSSEEEIKIIREAITKFRMMFIEWVATFEKDEFEDEWGLFI